MTLEMGTTMMQTTMTVIQASVAPINEGEMAG
jgi:hypothetical protein